LVLLVLVPLIPASSAQAQAGPVHVAVTSYNGLRLSLSVPQRAYPRNALVRVSVRLQNISHHTLVLGKTCYTPTLWAEVTNQAQNVRFYSYSPVWLSGGVAACGSKPLSDSALRPRP
jgi:hypothetical protein